MESSTNDISTRFFNGMSVRGYTEEQTKQFKYCGGDDVAGINYFNFFQHLAKPDHANNCVCGQVIKRNDYITDGLVVIATGQCCIKKFLPAGQARRTCEICSAPHKSKVKNRCKECMHKKKERVVGQCFDCDKKVKGDFYRCFNCNLIKNN